MVYKLDLLRCVRRARKVSLRRSRCFQEENDSIKLLQREKLVLGPVWGLAHTCKAWTRFTLMLSSLCEVAVDEVSTEAIFVSTLMFFNLLATGTK